MAKNKDDRLQFMFRYRLQEDKTVQFIDPCHDEMPVTLAIMLYQAFNEVQNKWNNQITEKQNEKRNKNKN